MTDTPLDQVTALVVIDLQHGIVALPTVHPADQVVAHAAQLATAFRTRRLPVVLVTVVGSAPGRTDQAPPEGSVPDDWADLVPELEPNPDDIVVQKRRWGAFQTTDLRGRLDGLGVTQIVLAGIATSMGVESTARAAHEHGYHVTVAVDAVTDTDPAAHTNSVQRIFPAIAQLRTTRDILDALEHLTTAATADPTEDPAEVTA